MRLHSYRVLAVAGMLVMSAACMANAARPGAQVQRAAAFARLYAVVRYFYPGDSAQTIDWNRLAVYGMQQAATPMSRAQWRDRLNGLFSPLGPGIDVAEDGHAFPAWHGGRKAPLVAWRHVGFTDAPHPGVYSAERTGRAQTPPFVGISAGVPTTALLGQRIRLSGEIRALDDDARQGAGLWLRVDRKGKPPAFFHNTIGEQVHDRGWHAYSIEAPVSMGTTDVAFGFVLTLEQRSTASTTAAVRNLKLELGHGDGEWEPVPIPALAAAGGKTDAWYALGATGSSRSQLTWKPDTSGHGYLAVSGRRVDDPSMHVVPGDTATFPLGDGLKARVALTLGDEEALPANERAARLDALAAKLDAIAPTGLDTAAARQADVAETWGVLRHFYPYWDVIHLDWDAALPRALADAAGADSRRAQKHVLERLIAPLQDAHGTVWDSTHPGGATLPLSLAPVGEDWVVVASNDAQANIGDVVTAVDGVPMSKAAPEAEARASGRPATRIWKAMQDLQWGHPGETRTLALRHADGHTDTITLSYVRGPTALPARPAAIAELKPGIWYLDLSRVALTDYTAHMSDLAHAKAVIYDVRAYPKDVKLSTTLLTHLLRTPEHADWMHVPLYVGPFGKLAGYKDSGWNLQPASPHFSSRALFLIGGNTISQAEAIVGYVQDDKLGTLIGSTTRGVDGNITRLMTPSGFGVIFTGMKVTHHDGVSRYQALGTPADIEIKPTLQGLRAGRDEVLEAALRVAGEPRTDTAATAEVVARPPDH